jgi:hypothetical protein
VGSRHELEFPGVPEAEQVYEILARLEGGVTVGFTHSGFPAVDDAYRDFTYD